MIKINLIREARTARAVAAPGMMPVAAAAPANINQMLLLACLIGSVVLAGSYWLLKKRVLSSKERQVAVRREEAQKLEAIIKEVEDFQRRKESLEKRIALINNLKKNQKGPVRVMDRISQDLPDLVWLDNMTLNGTSISVEGRGLNPNAVATFVENVKADPMFDEPEVSQITQDAVQQGPNRVTVYRYQMTFNFTYTPPGTAPAAGTPPAPGAPAAAPGQ